MKDNRVSKTAEFFCTLADIFAAAAGTAKAIEGACYAYDEMHQEFQKHAEKMDKMYVELEGKLHG